MSDRKEKRRIDGLPNSSHDSSNNSIPLLLVHEAWQAFANENRIHPHLIQRFKQRLNDIAIQGHA